jgi:ABC-type glutathione transport system ATPase component
MYAQSSSTRRNREFDSANDRELTLEEATHNEETVALRVAGLSKRYGAIEAVAGVSFDVRQGEIFGLLGLNGAGKTTLISMLAANRRPSAGDALLTGHSIRREPGAVRQMTGVAPPADPHSTLEIADLTCPAKAGKSSPLMNEFA